MIREERLIAASGRSENDSISGGSHIFYVVKCKDIPIEGLLNIVYILAEVIISRATSYSLGFGYVIKASCNDLDLMIDLLGDLSAVNYKLGGIFELDFNRTVLRLNDLALKIAGIGAGDVQILYSYILRILDDGEVHTSVEDKRTPVAVDRSYSRWR